MTSVSDARPLVQRVRFLALRRVSQLAVLALFLLGPLADLWLIEGNLSGSLVLDTVPLTDPFVFVQTLVAGHAPETTTLIGALIVAGLYFLLGGRAYCAWVCPVNPFTDLAAWLRGRLGLRRGWTPSRHTRHWILATILGVSVVSGSVVWELVNPVSLTHRAILFGLWGGFIVLASVFLLDVFVSPRGWCGRLCPMGAFYGVLGHFSPLKVAATHRAACDDCAKCYVVCPEPFVLKAPLKGADQGAGTVIASGACTNCGRCIDVCPRDVFRYSIRRSREMELL